MIDVLNLLWICPLFMLIGAVFMAALMGGFAAWVVREERKEDKDD